MGNTDGSSDMAVQQEVVDVLQSQSAAIATMSGNQGIFDNNQIYQQDLQDLYANSPANDPYSAQVSDFLASQRSDRENNDIEQGKKNLVALTIGYGEQALDQAADAGKKDLQTDGLLATLPEMLAVPLDVVTGVLSNAQDTGAVFPDEKGTVAQVQAKEEMQDVQRELWKLQNGLVGFTDPSERANYENTLNQKMAAAQEKYDAANEKMGEWNAMTPDEQHHWMEVNSPVLLSPRKNQ
jgi:hypothetical protein